jgi:hypothetical protein
MYCSNIAGITTKKERQPYRVTLQDCIPYYDLLLKISLTKS